MKVRDLAKNYSPINKETYPFCFSIFHFEPQLYPSSGMLQKNLLSFNISNINTNLRKIRFRRHQLD